MSETKKNTHGPEKPADSLSEAGKGEENAQSDQATGERGGGRAKPRRGRRVGLVAFFALAVAAVFLAVAAFVVIGRPLVAPVWLKDRIEAQVNRQLDAVQIGLGQVTLVVEQGWHPRVQLRDIDISDADGRSLLTLADVEGTLALRPLISGQVQPARIWLTGAQLVLRRDITGEVGLSFGETSPSAREAASFVQLIEEADRALVTPALSALKQLSADGLTLRYEDVRAGRAWTVDGGRIDLIRDNDDLTLRGDFALLSGGSSAATVEMSYESRIGSSSAAFGINFQDVEASDIAVQSGALLWLNVLRAPISGALRGATDETGNLGPLSATLQIGEGVLQPTDETKPIPFQAASSYFTYIPETQSMQFDELSVDSEWGTMKAEGRVVLGGIENGFPQEFIGQMRVSEISANPQNLYAEPVQFSNVTMDTRLRLSPFQLTLGEMTLRDGERNLVLGGELNARPEGWELSLEGHLDTLSPERLLQLWPESSVPRTREWVARNILGGEMHNLQLGLSSEPGHKPVVYLGWEFEGLDTRFMKAMPPIRGGRGHATLFRNTLTVRAEDGQVQADQGGAVDIAGTVFTIPDVRAEFAPAYADLRTNSTITAVLSLLDREPFRFISTSGQSVTMADGAARVTGRADFRLKKDLPAEEVTYSAQADLRNVRSETLIPGRVFVAPLLRVEVDNAELRVAGKGRVGQVPVTGTFSALLGKERGGKSSVDGTIELSQRFVEEFRLGFPDGSVSGTGFGTVKIDMQRGEKPSFMLRSDLSGVGLSVPQIGWSIGQDTRGTLEVSGRLSEPIEVSKVGLDAPGLDASGRVELGEGGQFIAARFDRVRAGGWLDAPVALRGRGAGNPPEVVVEGGTVDLSKTEIGAGTGAGGNSGGGPLKVTLDRLKISEGISLTQFRGDFTTARGMNGSFTGRVNGGAPVTGRIVPQKGRSAFQINSNDAGGVFKSAGLLPNARDGSMQLTLAPGSGKGVYEGQLSAKGVRLINAPSMAALLNAISVIGLLEQLSGNGILFNEVDARFRLTPRQAIIARSSAVGASMGISMDGYYSLENGAMNMQGVISPFYLVNSIGSVLTRKGEGLIGFNYSLSGTAEQPRVSVNPLSLLTPGMFREIFRRPPPKLTQ